jgi:hypothetical protein
MDVAINAVVALFQQPADIAVTLIKTASID